MSQLSMLTYEGSVLPPKPTEQAAQLARVEGRLAEAILAWCTLHEHQQFRMAELTEAITAHLQAAPDSARRILGQLRKQGRVECECVNRAESLYRLGSVR